jgi:hypothetical protein
MPQQLEEFYLLINEMCGYNKGTCPLVEKIEHAFRLEYKGGFDVVIGNPPYGAKLDNNIQKYLNDKYIKGGSETVISFIKLSYDNLLNSNGIFGFIIPKAFTFSSNYEAIREYLLYNIYEIIDCKKVWKEVLLEQIILFFKKQNKTDFYNCGKLAGQSIKSIGQIQKQHFQTFGFYLNDISNFELNIGLKIRKSNKFVGDVSNNSRGGIFQNKISDIGEIEVLGGAEIQRYGVVGIKGKVDKNILIDDSKCFINENSILVQNIVAHIENPIDHIKITACLPIKKDYAIVDTINQLTFNQNYSNKVFWLILNSKLINWYCYRFIFARAIRTMHFDNSITNRIPISENFDAVSQLPFIEKADQMLNLNKELQAKKIMFISRIKSNFSVEKMTEKLDKFYNFDFKTFVAELKKQKLTLSLVQQDEWEQYFNIYKTEINDIQSQIETTDNQIDQMVYKLYDLTDKEIAIIGGLCHRVINFQSTQKEEVL